MTNDYVTDINVGKIESEDCISRQALIDPCCGSATTLRAAHELGRSAFGFEIDRNFYERAKNEMLVFPEKKQMDIFDYV